MESLAITSSRFWRGRSVFITGHTGFKGSWLSLWLQTLGADITGYALRPSTDDNLYTVSRVAEGMSSIISDIRDLEALQHAMNAAQPDIVFHMAAQPLVRRSYEDPIETYSTNIMGTVNLLEAVRNIGTVKAVVVVTTDKCYENKEWDWPYRENDPIGGRDPYSSSKACAELIADTYRSCYFGGVRQHLKDQPPSTGVAIATARAGNVIGGGDWAEDRLIPCLLKAFKEKKPVILRHPNAVRPWQHVLEPLKGYLMLAELLYIHGKMFSESWNFGPSDSDSRSVGYIVETMSTKWGHKVPWLQDNSELVHESKNLTLDISKARARLKWLPRWSLDHALDQVIHWHRAWLGGEDMRKLCLSQIVNYTSV